MLESDSRRREVLTPEELFEQALLLLDDVIRTACRRRYHSPTPEDVGRLRQRLIVLLRNKDLLLLRSYRQEAKLRTWLQTVASRQVSRFLQDERRKVYLDELPDDFFTALPMQEDEVLRKERMESLKKAVKRLTKGQRQLLGLLESGLSESEIAQKKGVKVEAVYQAKSRLIKKLRKLITE